MRLLFFFFFYLTSNMESTKLANIVIWREKMMHNNNNTLNLKCINTIMIDTCSFNLPESSGKNLWSNECGRETKGTDPLNNVWLMLIDNNWLLIVVHVNCCNAACSVTQHVAMLQNQIACLTLLESMRNQHANYIVAVVVFLTYFGIAYAQYTGENSVNLK